MKAVQVGVAVIVYRNIGGIQNILMGKRKGAHGAGTWSFPGGHLEYKEDATDAAIRELEEETGITKDKIWDIIQGPFVESVFEKEDKHYITLLFQALLHDNIDVNVELREPDKCEKWVWVSSGHSTCGTEVLPSPLFLPVQQLVDKKFPLFSDWFER